MKPPVTHQELVSLFVEAIKLQKIPEPIAKETYKAVTSVLEKEGFDKWFGLLMRTSPVKANDVVDSCLRAQTWQQISDWYDKVEKMMKSTNEF